MTICLCHGDLCELIIRCSWPLSKEETWPGPLTGGGGMVGPSYLSILKYFDPMFLSVTDCGRVCLWCGFCCFGTPHTPTRGTVFIPNTLGGKLGCPCCFSCPRLVSDDFVAFVACKSNCLEVMSAVFAVDFSVLAGRHVIMVSFAGGSDIKLALFLCN